MARRTAEEVAGIPLSLVYIAGNLAHAEAAERWITEAGIDYTLRVEPFTTMSVMGGEYMGLFVYVPTADHRRCRDLLEARGLIDTVELDEQPGEERVYGA